VGFKQHGELKSAEIYKPQNEETQSNFRCFCFIWFWSVALFFNFFNVLLCSFLIPRIPLLRLHRIKLSRHVQRCIKHNFNLLSAN